MTWTERKLQLLKTLRRYKFLTIQQLRHVVIPYDKDGSITRSEMRKLEAKGFAQRRKTVICDPIANSAKPVWCPTEKGCLALATRTGDMSLMLDADPTRADYHSLNHFVAVSDFAIHLDTVITSQNYVKLLGLHFEHDIFHKDASDPEKKFRLYTVITEQPNKRIVCVPDAAFAIETQGSSFRKAYMIELERGTDTPRRVAAKKAPGYFGLHASKKYQQIFPDVQEFSVLAICPNAGWRDALRSAIKGKPGDGLWRFVAGDEIRNNVLIDEIIYSCDKGPLPLVRSPAATPIPESA